ncbi:MAG: 16S rRNA (cytidine(1402)-2'-O)-methyltransferase [Gammaproteobacteria bacterium]|nr:MAG: 16S rRNA (cytidine(1402)-2'-O)-methyltransferase [Gammaproteobacteria bacterium]
MTNKTGVLYVVATPIGNLRDISARAIDTLKDVSRIAAEDTRHSKKLLSHYGIRTPMTALHEHNEAEQSAMLLKLLESGEDLALIADAGTPLISDPGYFLVRTVRAAGIRVVPVPGPSAGIAALSASGLPSDRFVCEGFLPPRQSARRQRLEALRQESRTVLFYESTHRITGCLQDMVAVFGGDREAVIARELTKTFETIQGGTLNELVAWLQADNNQRKGEFVILLHGAPEPDRVEPDARDLQVLKVLLRELPLKQAAGLAAKITGVPKNRLYEKGITLKRDDA